MLQNQGQLTLQQKIPSFKIPSKRAIPKTAETAGDLIDNKITTQSAPSMSTKRENATKNVLEIPKEKYIPTEKRQIIDHPRLI